MNYNIFNLIIIIGLLIVISILIFNIIYIQTDIHNTNLYINKIYSEFVNEINENIDLINEIIKENDREEKR